MRLAAKDAAGNVATIEKLILDQIRLIDYNTSALIDYNVSFPETGPVHGTIEALSGIEAFLIQSDP